MNSGPIEFSRDPNEAGSNGSPRGSVLYNSRAESGVKNAGRPADE